MAADGEAWLDAEAAAALLGVKRRTLYAYVSRGRVRSRPGSQGPGRRYAREDLERLRARSAARRGHEPVAAAALRWGDPVIESAVTTLSAEGPRYRSRLATELAAAGARFEEVTELLLTGRPGDPASWKEARPGRRLRLPRGTPQPLDALVLRLGAQAMADPQRFASAPPARLARARRLLRGLAWAAGEGALRDSVAATLAEAFGLRGTARERAALDVALVLSADHELNASTFAARVAASAGADAYGAVAAGLAALGGTKHGGAVLRVASLCGSLGDAADVPRTLQERLARGEGLPGFGHPLYAQGDPRTPPLLEQARRIGARRRHVRTVLALVDAVELVGAGKPTLDLGLYALSRALGLPPGAGVVIFAVGRAAGWLAHAQEQADQGYAIRPRARPPR
ncbi:MAG: citrate/2-methylcitrate synthase [Myxococcota bacterium]